MPQATWVERFTNWYNWFRSADGPYFNGSTDPIWDYYIKNFFYAGQPFYNKAFDFMLTLSEGQSYGLMYALMADDPIAFLEVYGVLDYRHRLTRTNIDSAKATTLATTTPAWPEEFCNFMDNEGRFIFDVKGANAALATFGWVWSENYSPDATDRQGLSSMYMAPDGDVVFAACLLLGYERWNLVEYKNTALEILTDLAQYGVRKCGSRYALTMGQYRGPGGFILPSPQTVVLNGGSVFTGSDEIIFPTADLTTGDKIRFFLNAGSTMPGGLTGQDGAGTTWPAYFIRVNDAFNASFYPTKADALANTNKINITSTGSGSVVVYPYECQAGQVGTDPSYLFPPFFKLFAKYDTANAAVWNSVATNAYGDIEHSCTLNFWNMPTYLDGVNVSTGANEFFRAGGDSAAHNADAVRTVLNMAFDGSTDALDTIKTQCQFNAGTGLWEPKFGEAGGLWRFYNDTGFLPFTFGSQPISKTIENADINLGANQIDLKVDYLADTGGYTNPIRFTGGDLPLPFNDLTLYYPRKAFGNIYTLHPTRADALGGANTIDITTTGSGSRKWDIAYVCTFNTTTDEFTLASSSGAFKTGRLVTIAANAAGSVPAGTSAATGYYGRLLAHNRFSLHPTETDAYNNTNKVNGTTVGSGEIGLSRNDVEIGWYYRFQRS